MSVIDRMMCLLGRHERSRSKAVRYVDNTVLSECRHCGKSMFRHPREGWMMERRKEQRTFEKAQAGRHREHSQPDPDPDEP